MAKARLSFSQKVNLMDSKSPLLSRIKAGVAQLNTIRNRLAHRLDAGLTPADVEVFMQSPIFVSMQFVAQNRPVSTLAPIEIMELFAQYAANSLAGEFSKFSLAFGQALEEAKTQRDA